jgi:hypothetical protein
MVEAAFPRCHPTDSKVTVTTAPVVAMQSESNQTELARLRREQSQTRQEEVFGGLSLEERVEYELKGDRIRQLERELLVQAEVRIAGPSR